MNVVSSALSKTIRIDVVPQLTGLPRHPGVSPHRDEHPDTSSASSGPASPIRTEDYIHFFENAYDATLITDQQGGCLIANRRVTELLGYDLESLRKVNFWQLVSGADASLIDTVRNSLAAERFLRISAWCIRQDGSNFSAEIAVNLFISGESTFFCFCIRDETLRTQAESQLRTVQHAVKNASAGIGVAEITGVLLYANTAMAALFGETNPKLLKGRKLDDLLGNDKLVRDLIDAVKEGQSALVEIPLPRADGSACWIQIAVAPNLDSDEALIGMVLSLVDISDRRRAEEAERVVDRDRVMIESIGAVSHHLGQPATVLLSSLELMNRLKDADHEQRKELLQMSIEAAESLRKTLLELNELRHYNAEPYPGPDASCASSIVAIQPPTPDAAG